MSPLQNGNTAPLAPTTGDFYVPSAHESNTVPSTHSIGEQTSRSDLVSDAANLAMQAASAGESAIPQSVLAQNTEQSVHTVSSVAERLGSSAEINEQAINIGNRLHSFRSSVDVRM